EGHRGGGGLKTGKQKPPVPEPQRFTPNEPTADTCRPRRRPRSVGGTMPDHITHDPIYNTVDRDDFAGMIDVDRYGERTDAFDGIIAATQDHFWDPTDAAY